MSRWMQVVAVARAAVVPVIPTSAQLGYAQALHQPTSILPMGEELGDEDLLATEGELVLKILIIMGLTGLGSLVEQWFFDEDYGLDWNDAGVIGVRMATAGVVSLVGSCRRLGHSAPVPSPGGGGGWGPLQMC